MRDWASHANSPTECHQGSTEVTKAGDVAYVVRKLCHSCTSPHTRVASCHTPIATLRLSCTAHFGRSVLVVCELRLSFRLSLGVHGRLTCQHAVHAHTVDRCTMLPHSDQILDTAALAARTRCTCCMHHNTTRYHYTPHQWLRSGTNQTEGPTQSVWGTIAQSTCTDKLPLHRLGIEAPNRLHTLRTNAAPPF